MKPASANKIEKKQGVTLAAHENLTSDMALIYERSVGARQDSFVHERPAVIFPRGASRVEVTLDGMKSPLRVTGSMLLCIPPRVTYIISGKSALFDVITILPHRPFVDELISENHLSSADQQTLLKKHFLLNRSRWIDDLIERYFFERVENAYSPVGCSFFLEKQILNEIARLIFPKVPTTGDLIGEEPSNLAVRAINYIEGHLFDELDIEKICKHLGSSEPTLARAFKKEFEQTPGAYIKERRLDEAAILVERGDYRIGDVCMLVGYDDLSSFSRAFKARFGVSPNDYRLTRKPQ